MKKTLSKDLLAKIEFEQETIYQIEVAAEMCTSDAQAFLEVHEQIYDAGYSNGLTPQETAELIVKAVFNA